MARTYRRVVETGPPPSPQQQLGDWVESRLKSIGVTKESYQAVKAAMGLPPTCDCDERKEWLNQLGEKFGVAAKAAWSKLWKDN